MYIFFKRLIDLLVSLSLLFISLPLLIIIALSIKLTSGKGSVLYRGKRASKYGEIFYLLKFRTMVHDAEKLGGPSTAINDSRLTPIGRFLRKCKLDELPQLINVVKGEMSLVGPRPQVLEYTKEYQGEDLIILSVLPGVTDLASLYFLDMDTTLGETDVDEVYKNKIEPIKNKLRVQYVKNRGFALDLRILIETFFSLLGIRGITSLKFDI